MKFVTVEEIKAALEIPKAAKAKATDKVDKEVYNSEEWYTGIIDGTSWYVHRKVDVQGRFTAQIQFDAWASNGKSGVDSAKAVIKFHAPEMGSAEDAEEMAEVICEDCDLLEKIAQELCF